MAVDRGDQRLGPGVERAEAIVQRVDQTALAETIELGHELEIQPGREGAALAPDDGSLHRRLGGEAFEQAAHLLEQRRIHGVHRRMGQGHDGDAVGADGKIQAGHARGLRTVRT
jgi:hypothetical protein